MEVAPCTVAVGTASDQSLLCRACVFDTDAVESTTGLGVIKPEYGCCWDLHQFSSTDGTCSGSIIDNHWGVNTTCYNSGGTNLRCINFSIDFSPSNTPLEYNFRCGGCGETACRTFVLYEEQCNKGSNDLPYPTDFLVKQHK